MLAGRYRLLELLGIGGMSTVWRARDDVLGRAVAVKVLAGPYTVDVRFRTVIGREARAVAGLSHPNIVAVHDYGEARSPGHAVLPFVVMELLEGEPLQTRLDQGPLPWRAAVRICAEVAAALTEAHRHGVVHRDVTPGNIICTPGGSKVVDFGIAAAIGEPDEDATGLMFGTVEYIAPERLDGGPANAATDVFALGVLLYELATGEPPFPAADWDEVAAAHQAGPPPPPDALPAHFAELCVRCLSMDPERRPTAGQAADILSSRRATLRAQLPRSHALRRTREAPAPRHQRLLQLIAATVVISGAATTIALLPFAASGPRTTVVAPIPLPTPVLTNAPAPAPLPSPSLILSEGPTTPPPADPAERFEAVVQAGVARGEIRPDVATDLRNLLGGLEQSVANVQQGEVTSRTATLRRTIDERAGKGEISQGVARDLRAALAGFVSPSG